jgi:hypothetical protein
MDLTTLIALHGHFLAADAIKQFLFADVPVDDATSVQLGDMMDGAQFWSRVMRLQVFYALMYVVVEGYQELGCQDPAVDRLLAQSDFVDSFRRFRNAVFHYQGEPISPKLTEFLDSKGSEQWTQDLYRALKGFFESQPPIKEFLDSLPERG